MLEPSEILKSQLRNMMGKCNANIADLVRKSDGNTTQCWLSVFLSVIAVGVQIREYCSAHKAFFNSSF